MHLTASGPYRPHHRPPLRPLVLLLLLLTTSACAAVKVKPARPRERAGAEHSVLSSRELSPDNPVLRALAELPVVPAVTFHTVVGDRGLGNGPETRSDGIVSYRSSHLEGAASELIVPSGHNAHQHPATIAEVRRILYEHLGVAGVGGPVASEPRAGEAEGVHDDGDRAEGHGHTGEHR